MSNTECVMEKKDFDRAWAPVTKIDARGCADTARSKTDPTGMKSLSVRS